MNLSPCSPAEAAHALSMVQDRTSGAECRVSLFLISRALADDIAKTTKPIRFTTRELAGSVFGSSISRSRVVLARMVDHRLIEVLHRGTNGHDPSEARFLHPTHWDFTLARGIDREEFGRRAVVFSASLTGALIDPSARVPRTCAPMGAAVSISRLNDSLARATLDARAAYPTARATVDARDRPRQIPFSSRDEISHSLEGGSEGESSKDPRGDELLAAIKRGGGGRKIWGAPAKRATYLAQECNGRLPELVEIAAAPNGPVQTMAILGELEAAFRRPTASASSGRPTGRAEQLGRDLAAAERAGDSESVEALR